MQTSLLDPMRNRAALEPQAVQLLQGNHPVLASRKACQSVVASFGSTCLRFCMHFMQKLGHVAHLPPVRDREDEVVGGTEALLGSGP